MGKIDGASKNNNNSGRMRKESIVANGNENSSVSRNKPPQLKLSSRSVPFTNNKLGNKRKDNGIMTPS